MSGAAMDPELHALAASERAAKLDELRTPEYRPPAPIFNLDDLHGPVADWVRTWEPFTEAPPVAVYAVALATCGALLGRGPSWTFGNVAHHARLFPVLIGPSGAGRKGTALAIGGRVLLANVDPDFNDARVASGLSSAEGLIAEVRDARLPTLDELSGKTLDHGDPGVIDKRLLAIEGEIAGPLEAMTREGNRMSAIIRDAWDGMDLRSMTKRDPQRATAPHIVIIGAITATELRKLLSSTALTNGLANRLLPIWCERSRLLPEDAAPDPREVARVSRLIASRLDGARTIATAHWTPAAAAQWAVEYEKLAVLEDASGTIRVLLERGAPYVRRLAFTLALLDGSRDIDTVHLDAALALWRFAADTWRHIYHDGVTRSDLAEKLLAALTHAGPEGLTRTAIRETVVRSNDVPAERITAALAELSGAGLAIRCAVPTGGRPTERWHHARHVGALPTSGGKGDKEGKPDTPTADAHLPPFSPFPPSSRRVGAHPAAEPVDDNYWSTFDPDAA
jgi:hypothetical protein